MATGVAFIADPRLRDSKVEDSYSLTGSRKEGHGIVVFPKFLLLNVYHLLFDSEIYISSSVDEGVQRISLCLIFGKFDVCPRCCRTTDRNRWSAIRLSFIGVVESVKCYQTKDLQMEAARTYSLDSDKLRWHMRSSGQSKSCPLRRLSLRGL